MKDYRFCICGGGSLGSVMASMISSKGYIVNLLSNHANLWSNSICTEDVNGKKFIGNLNIISNNPEDVIPESDIILFCLPGYLITSELKKIKPYLGNNHIVGSIVSSTGFFISALSELGHSAKLYGFQRVPFVSKVKEYGRSACLTGYKSYLNIATCNIEKAEDLRLFFEYITSTHVNLLGHVLEAALTNSNPLLHPTRLYRILSKWDGVTIFPEEMYFYRTWDDESSEILLTCDNEFQTLLSQLPVDRHAIPSLLEYYESYDAHSLTIKLNSIAAFKDVKVPMVNVDQGYIPDVSHRFFCEDIPYGLLIIKCFAEIIGISSPQIDTIIEWAQKIMNKRYISNHKILYDSDDVKYNGSLNKEAIKYLISLK